jgi:hypothetical protein
MNYFVLIGTLMTAGVDLPEAGLAGDPVFNKEMDKAILVVQAPAAEEMKGRVVTSTGGAGLAGVTVMLLDSDGAILDVTETSPDGKYVLDLGVLDEATPESVGSLYLEITIRKNSPVRIRVADILRSFSRTVQLREVTFK